MIPPSPRRRWEAWCKAWLKSSAMPAETWASFCAYFSSFLLSFVFVYCGAIFLFVTSRCLLLPWPPSHMIKKHGCFRPAMPRGWTKTTASCPAWAVWRDLNAEIFQAADAGFDGHGAVAQTLLLLPLMIA